MNRAFISSIAAVIVFGGVAVAHPTDVSQVTVSYADLDVSREAGAKILINRIRDAAERVCGERPSLMDLTGWSLYQGCVKKAEDQAVASTHEPVVARLYGKAESSEMADR